MPSGRLLPLPVDRRLRNAELSTGITAPYVERGGSDGRPVVLLHAGVECRDCFDRLLPRLPAALHVVAMEQ